MNINELIAIIKKKLENNINIESIKIEDKTFLHKNHLGNEKGKYHLKLTVTSKELKSMNKLECNRKIHKVIQNELKDHIHSIQILIS